jgi:hypothetical protein
VVPEVTVMLGEGRGVKSTRLFFLEIRALQERCPLEGTRTLFGGSKWSQRGGARRHGGA